MIVCLVGGAVTYMYVNGLPGWLEAVLEGEEGEDEPVAGKAAWRLRLDNLG